jgi:hypothetical protein
MKKIALIIFLAIGLIQAPQARNHHNDGDSLKINIDKRTKSIVASDQYKPQGYSLLSDLRQLFASKNMELTDQTWQSIKEIVNSESQKDTVLKFSQGGKEIAIAFNMKEDSKARSSSDFDTDDNQIEDRPNRTNDNESVKIGKDGIHVKDGNDEVHISRRGVKIVDGNNEAVNIGFGNDDDSTANEKWKNKHEYGSLSGFNVYLGLNSFTNKTAKNYNMDDFALKPFGSRHFSMGWTKSTNITNGPNARLKVALGLNFTWYNFMLEKNSVWVKGPSQIEIVPSKESLKKSKLTVSYIEMPLVPYIAFKKGKFIEYFGFGGYASYRMNSHSKTKNSENNKKQKEFNNFYLNDFRYGLTAQLGINNFANLFVNYDLNYLFKENKGPNVSGISFGLRL